MDPIDGYVEEVFSRYQSLPEQEKEVLKTIPDSPFAAPLGKLLGPEMGDLFSSILSQDTPEEQVVEPTTLQDQVQPRRMGLGSR